ncbi:hypothetical protein ACFQ3N_11005 [Virgibacillus byunsanensis]|uniref:Uncharacterized protein n=1 Tax=Virgibacillus byunsanensis TaxID=570945 RepID=A0ABW3LN72_9BACI
MERLPDVTTIICTILAFAVPFFIYKINQSLHKYGDPPWKKEEN